MKRKLFAFVLIFTLILSGTVGCGSKKSSYDPDNFLPQGTAENPYQIVKEKVTIDVFVPL